MPIVSITKLFEHQNCLVFLLVRLYVCLFACFLVLLVCFCCDLFYPVFSDGKTLYHNGLLLTLSGDMPGYTCA